MGREKTRDYYLGYLRKVMDETGVEGFFLGAGDLSDYAADAKPYDPDATSRTVEIPPGTWRADDGTVTVGPARLVIETPLGRLPHFVREEPSR